jgi:hypothetical protein
MSARKVGQILRASGINVIHKVENGRRMDMILEVSRCCVVESFLSQGTEFSMKNFEVKEGRGFGLNFAVQLFFLRKLLASNV